jgi:hypothetical protein
MYHKVKEPNSVLKVPVKPHSEARTRVGAPRHNSLPLRNCSYMSQGTSTRVWQIYELAALIIQCTFSRQPSKSIQGCATLVALARVNRFLSEITLRDIWKVLDSGSPLVSLLPPDFEALVDPAAANKRMIKELDVSLHLHAHLF